MPTPRRAIAVIAVAAVVAGLGVATAEAAPGPPLTEPATARSGALQCSGDLSASRRRPVLLVHGTGATAEENWGNGYLPALLERGHSVCTVDIPGHAHGDVQVNVQYVVSAIRQVHRRSGRRIAVIGHSQGAFLPTYALRVWPDLLSHVADFIGLAGFYDRGSEAIGAMCDSDQGCHPSFQQFRDGAGFLGQLSRRTLPAGPAYTAIGTDADETVTPQPAANRMPGMRSIQLQEICPGRRSALPTTDHIILAVDAVGYALAVDALDHDGPADASRIDPAVCQQLFLPGVDAVGVVASLPGLLTRQGPTTKVAPRTRCYMLATCADLSSRGRMLTRVGVRGRPDSVVLTLRVQAPGRVRVRVGDVSVVRVLGAGWHRLTVARPRGADAVRVATRPRYYSAWALERRIALVG